LATELRYKKTADLNDYEPRCQFVCYAVTQVRLSLCNKELLTYFYMSENNPFDYTFSTDCNFSKISLTV